MNTTVNKPTDQKALVVYHELCDYLQMYFVHGYKIDESSVTVGINITDSDHHVKSLIDNLSANVVPVEKSDLLVQTEELLQQIVALQKRAAKRGLELIYAAGAKWKYYETPEFEFTEEGVSMCFREDTGHDCPESEGITLTSSELIMTETEWAAKIEQTKADTKRKKEEREQKRKDDELAEKNRQFEKLKAELGK